MAYVPSRGRWAGREFESRWEYRQARAKSFGFKNESELLRVTRSGDYKAAQELRRESGRAVNERWRFEVLRDIGRARSTARRAGRAPSYGEVPSDFDYDSYIDVDIDDDKDWYGGD